jgi:hypothetical protein
MDTESGVFPASHIESCLERKKFFSSEAVEELCLEQ